MSEANWKQRRPAPGGLHVRCSDPKRTPVKVFSLSCCKGGTQLRVHNITSWPLVIFSQLSAAVASLATSLWRWKCTGPITFFNSGLAGSLQLEASNTFPSEKAFRAVISLSINVKQFCCSIPANLFWTAAAEHASCTSSSVVFEGSSQQLLLVL